MKTPFASSSRSSIVGRFALSAALIAGCATPAIAQQPSSDTLHLGALPAGSVISLGSGIQSVSAPQVLHTKQPVVKLPVVVQEVVVAINNTIEQNDQVIAAVAGETNASNNPLSQERPSHVQLTQFSADAQEASPKEVGVPPAPRGRDAREQAQDDPREEGRLRRGRDAGPGHPRPRGNNPQADDRQADGARRGQGPGAARGRMGGMGPGAPSVRQGNDDQRADHPRHEENGPEHAHRDGHGPDHAQHGDHRPEYSPAPRPIAQHARPIDEILSSPAIKRILQLTTENIELKAELKVQKVEAEAQQEVLEIQVAKKLLELELVHAKQALIDAQTELSAAREKISELQEKLQGGDDDDDESDDDEDKDDSDDDDDDEDQDDDDDEDQDDDDKDSDSDEDSDEDDEDEDE